MASLILNNYGEPTMRASAFGGAELDDEFAKRAFLLFNQVMNAHPYEPANHMPTVLRFGEAGDLAFVGDNIAYLQDRQKLYQLRAGYDSTLLELIRHCQGLMEREFNEDCLVSPLFLDPKADLQPALSIRFLDGLAPPLHGASLEDVLRFNQENQQSLARFWNAVYDLAENPDGLILRSADRRLNALMRESLEELEASQHKAWGNSILNGFQISLALPLGVVAELAARQFFGDGYPEHLILLSSGALEISLGRQRVGQLSERAKAMTFLYDAKRKLPPS